MIVKNYDELVVINHNSNWPDHPYRILIIGSSGSGKTKVLLNLIKHQQPGIDKIYLYVKNPFKSKYILLRNRREKVGIKKFKKATPLIDYSKANDVYDNLEDSNPTKKVKVLIVFDEMI